MSSLAGSATETVTSINPPLCQGAFGSPSGEGLSLTQPPTADPTTSRSARPAIGGSAAWQGRLTC